MREDTIVAVATAPGPGGIGIIRLSGSDAYSIGKAITATDLKPRHAHFCRFYDREENVLDSGITLFFPAPNSFTGEDIVELQAHGGFIILDLLLRQACMLGARQALPGEFSQRAYLNDKIDLTQAEAIADLINSTTEEAALNASRSLQGVFSKKIESLIDLVTNLRIYVEAAIDFPEEEIDFLQNDQVSQQLCAISDQFTSVMKEANQGALIREGMKLVIAGKPNAGKSSLLNALSGQNTAIVTPQKGTTRDVLREHIQIDGLPIHIVDTAGLRESNDIIEREGIRRARAEILSADRILLVVDAMAQPGLDADLDELWQDQQNPPHSNIPVTVIRNKCDLTNEDPGLTKFSENVVINLSVKSGAGIEILRMHLKACMGYLDGSQGGFSARRRHLDSLEQARELFLHGRNKLQQLGAGELLAEDLRLCQSRLGDITGDITSDELLGAIFSSFCIGK